jgi:hypothetical protein
MARSSPRHIMTPGVRELAEHDAPPLDPAGGGRPGEDGAAAALVAAHGQQMLANAARQRSKLNEQLVFTAARSAG